MSKPSSKHRLEELRRVRNQRRMINQWVAIILGALIVIGLVWFFVLGQQKPATAAAATEPAAAAGATDQPLAPTAPAGTPAGNGKQYPAEPAMTIDPTKQYFADVKMAKGGDFVIQLFPDKAPRTVNSFVFLAKDGFFNGVTFHRVLDGFMAQGGDPTGSGSGGPGYEFANEANDLKFDKAGVVAMANAGPNTNGSQFFIMFGPYGLQESDYTIFGQVISGMDVVNGITRRDPQTNPTFPGDAIATVTITEK